MVALIRRRLRGERGFTLIELLIVVAIIAILAAILIPNFLQSRASAQVSASKSNMRNLATALEAYQADKLYYPGALADLVPTYIGSVPNDPCATSFGYSTTGTPPSDFRLTSNSGSDWTSNCKNVVLGIYYTPSQGLRNK